MPVYETLASLGIVLPPVTAPVAAFVPWVRCGDLLFLSGHVAKRQGKPWCGQLGASVTTDEGILAARGVAIDLIATLHAACGDLQRIQQIVKLTIFVNSAFGVAQVPFGCCVEIELVAQLSPDAHQERPDVGCA